MKIKLDLVDGSSMEMSCNDKYDFRTTISK